MDRAILVTGKDKISVKLDTIRLNIEVEGTYKEYSLLVKKSAEHTNLLRETISLLGINTRIIFISNWKNKDDWLLFGRTWNILRTYG